MPHIHQRSENAASNRLSHNSHPSGNPDVPAFHHNALPFLHKKFPHIPLCFLYCNAHPAWSWIRKINLLSSDHRYAALHLILTMLLSRSEERSFFHFLYHLKSTCAAIYHISMRYAASDSVLHFLLLHPEYRSGSFPLLLKIHIWPRYPLYLFLPVHNLIRFPTSLPDEVIYPGIFPWWS